MSRPPDKPGKPKRRVPIWARVVIAALLVLLIIPGIAYAYYQANYANSIANITGKQAIHHTLPGTKDGDNTTSANQGTTGGILTGGRFNVLLLGSDTDGKGNDAQTGIPLAQTDIIVSIDPQTKYVGMLSIPRDLQVTIPGGGSTKLDLVFSAGYRGKDIATRVASAAGLAEDTIQYNFGIHIDAYAWVGLQGFVKVIDTAGGVDVDVLHPMVDDVYPDDVNNQSGNAYDYKRLYIAPGPQHLNGPQALEYVRTRHSDLVGDFGRSQRQQQVLTQLKTKLATPAVIGQAGALLNALNGAVQTDLTLDKIIQVANYARTVDLNKLDRLTLSPPYSAPSHTSSNYFPNCSLIMPAIARMFSITSKCIPQADTGGASTTTTTQTTSTSVGPTPTPTGATPTPGATHTKGKNKANITGGNVLAMLSALSNIGDLSLSQSYLNPSGVHSILDLMFMVVFESFEAATV